MNKEKIPSMPKGPAIPKGTTIRLLKYVFSTYKAYWIIVLACITVSAVYMLLHVIYFIARNNLCC